MTQPSDDRQSNPDWKAHAGRASLRKMSERLYWSALAVFIFVLPVQHTIAIRYLAFLALAAATAMLLIAARRIPIFPLSGYWLIYACTALLSVPFALAVEYSLGEIRVEILYCLIVFILAASTSCVLRNAMHGISMIVVAANAIYVAPALAYLEMEGNVVALFDMPPIAFAGVNSNLMTTIMPLVAYAGVSFWQQGRRWLGAAILMLFLLDIGALVVSFNRQGLVALGGGVLCCGALVLRERFTWRRLATLALVLVMVAGLLAIQFIRRGYSPSSITATTSVSSAIDKDGRWELWKLAAQGIGDRPWTGYGFGRNTFSWLYPEAKKADKNHWHAHNMVLNRGVQTGVPGIVAFLLLWVALAREFMAHSRGATNVRFALSAVALSTLAMVFMKNMTDDFFVRDMALIFWLLMGFYVGTLHRWARQEATPVV